MDRSSASFTNCDGRSFYFPAFLTAEDALAGHSYADAREVKAFEMDIFSEEPGLDGENKRKMADMKAVEEKKLRQMDQSEQCDYCTQEMKKKRDPRELLCGHIFCLSCLKDDWASKGATSHKCITCKIIYEKVDFDSLPTANIPDEPEELTSFSTELRCDRCLEEPAVKYCIDCGVKTCAQHAKHHDGFFEELHKVLDISKYAENPSLYNKAVICKQHKDFITMACKMCYQYNCIQCCEEKMQCNGHSREHSYHPLAAIEKEITQTFTELLQQTTEKLAEIERLDKKAWNKHDQLLEECTKMLADVERLSGEQIRQIMFETQKLKEAIQQYQSETEEKVIKFCTELINKKEELEDVRKKTHRFLRNKHVTELIRVKQENVDLLTRANAIDIKEPAWAEKRLQIGCKHGLEVKLEALNSERNNSTSRPRPFFDSNLSWNGNSGHGMLRS